jgi:hypothetical protein
VVQRCDGEQVPDAELQYRNRLFFFGPSGLTPASAILLPTSAVLRKPTLGSRAVSVATGHERTVH